MDEQAYIEKRTKKCRHFNGLMNKTCDAGITYEQAGICWHPGRPITCTDGSGLCGLASYYTPEEAKQRYDGLNSSLKQWGEDIKNDICPNHKIPITKRQVGRCVYASPCNCRLYQGTLAPRHHDTAAA